MRTRDWRRAVMATPIMVVVLIVLAPRPLEAETLEYALVFAYQNNPQLNAQRAGVRATDENVSQALSGYRPKLSVSASGGAEYNDLTSKSTVAGDTISNRQKVTTATYSVGATATQTLYNGNQTANRTRQAEGQVLSAREALRVMEQTVLLGAASAYMEVLRDAAIVEVQRSNVHVLEETLGQTRERYDAREVTRTDVAQARAQLAASRFALQASESTLTSSRANYRRVIGAEPNTLNAATPIDRFAPRTLAAAIEQGLMQNPNVTAAMHGIDVAYLQVKIAEGALFPTVTLQANAQKSFTPQPNVIQPVTDQFSASVIGQITVPIYQGGSEYSLIRQSKESVAQQRLFLDQVRDQTRATVVQSWGQIAAAKIQIEQALAQVDAAEVALNGVREEARVGQRTTLDVLNAQQALVNARISLLIAQHDRIVGSYSLVAAAGGLSPLVLGLNTEIYDPTVHYQQVRDAWIGLRAPDSGHFSPARDAAVQPTNQRAAPSDIINKSGDVIARPQRAADNQDKKPRPLPVTRAALAAPISTSNPAPAGRLPGATTVAAAPQPERPPNPTFNLASKSDAEPPAASASAPTIANSSGSTLGLLSGADRIMPTSSFATPLSAFR
jgi:outer membrane protein